MTRFNAYPIYLILRGSQRAFFALVFTINMLYQVETVGLSPLQLVLVGTSLELSVLIFEVPTGIVADLYSRRLSVIIGTFVIGLGFLIEGLFPVFEAIILSQIVWGLGYTFISGAADAWIADEINDDKRLTNILLRASQASSVSALFGIGISVALASVFIRLPIITAGVMFGLLGIFLILFMPETGFKPVDRGERQTYQAMLNTLKEAFSLVRGRPLLIIILITTVFYGMYSEGYDRLWTKHMLDNFSLPSIGNLDTVVWFGIFNVVSMLLSLGATEVLRRLIDQENPDRVVRPLFIIVSIIFAGLLMYANANSFALLMAAYWTIGTMRSLYYPLWLAWINQHVRSEVRATMLSAAGQIDAFGQIAGGPIWGTIGNLGSTRLAISAASTMLLPVLWLYTRLMRGKVESAVDVEPVPTA
jgi:DHA3 family tetracycline resistance protein-like MFS transporter